MHILPCTRNVEKTATYDTTAIHFMYILGIGYFVSGDTPYCRYRFLRKIVTRFNVALRTDFMFNFEMSRPTVSNTCCFGLRLESNEAKKDNITSSRFIRRLLLSETRLNESVGDVCVASPMRMYVGRQGVLVRIAAYTVVFTTGPLKYVWAVTGVRKF